MPMTVDDLAQEIRRVDGNHSIGARQRKRQAKLARRAKRHAGKAKGDFDASN